MTRTRKLIVCRCGCNRSGVHVNSGFIGACYQRWLRAGKPAGGPPTPQLPHPLGPRADRVEDYAFLRAHGVSVAEAAARVGVCARTGWDYEAQLRAGRAGAAA